MPLDPSIALQARPLELQNPLAAYAQAMQLQGVQNQSALAQYTLAKAQRDDEAANALAAAYRGAVSPDGTINRGALIGGLAQGRAAGQIPAVQKSLLESDKALAALDKDKAETLKTALGISGGALATISQNPTRENAVRVATQLVQSGLPGADKLLASIPQTDAEVGPWVRLHAGTTEHSLKVLEALQPKVSMQDVGGYIQPTNTNTLAGPLGPIPGAATIQKTMTPDARATDARARERLAFDQNQERKAPNGYRWTPEGNLEGIPGGPGVKDKALTESQGKATGMAIRARESADIINELEKGGTTGMISGAKESVRAGLDKIPVVGPSLGSSVGGLINKTVVPASSQRYEQAKRDFVNAVLRVESGASISQSEFDNADRQYFPQSGDSTAVIEQKRKNRETAIKALTTQGGNEGAKQVPQSRTLDAGGGWTIKRVD